MYHPIQLIRDISLVAYYWVKLDKRGELTVLCCILELYISVTYSVSRESRGDTREPGDELCPKLVCGAVYLSVSSREYISSGGKGMSCFLRSHKPNSLQQCLNAVCECLHFYEFVDLIFLVLSFDFHFSSIFLFW